MPTETGDGADAAVELARRLGKRCLLAGDWRRGPCVNGQTVALKPCPACNGVGFAPEAIEAIRLALAAPTAYVSNGEAGDGQTICKNCGEETEGHTWKECAEGLQRARGMLLDSLIEAECRRERDVAAAERRGEDRVLEMLREWAATQAGVALLKEADDAPCSAWEHERAARLIAWGERAVWHRLMAIRAIE